MLAFFRSLFGHSPPSRRQMMALQDHVEGLEARIEQHYGELKALRGLVNATIRREKLRDDAPGEEISSEEVPQDGPPPKRYAPSAHLARRFRSF